MCPSCTAVRGVPVGTGAREGYFPLAWGWEEVLGRVDPCQEHETSLGTHFLLAAVGNQGTNSKTPVIENLTWKSY